MSRGAEYREGLDRYRAFVRSQPAGAETSEERIEHQFECLRDWSLTHSLEEVEHWFEAQRRDCPMAVTEIPLNQTEGWVVDPATGNVQHQSGEFFQVHGVRVSETGGREVGARGWSQPILTQTGYDGGILGMLRQRHDEIPHYLIEAKAEPGNYGKLQLSPTLQATFSNLKRAHEGRKPRFAEYFETPDSSGGRVLYRAWLSEDGGRLYLKRNLGMLVEVPQSLPIEVPPGFIWMSMYQIKALLQRDAWINPHIRGIIAHL